MTAANGRSVPVGTLATRLLIACWVLLAFAACSNTPPREKIFSVTPKELQQIRLVYYSDYFSFIGSDRFGLVAFAIDNNRGQDGNSWQADHFVVLYDELIGWQDMQGNGLYDNPDHKLETIPDSKYFSFRGSPADGMVITSVVNELQLRIAPVSTVISHRKGMSEYRLGSAAATLSWNGRMIRGRVIHEYLFLPAFNRLTRTYVGLFDDFHGIYAVVNGADDFYLHRQQSDFLAQLTGKQEGFLVHDGKGYPLQKLTVDVPDRSFAAGFYRWPQQWQGSFVANDDTYHFDLTLTQKNIIANWFIGGFAMGVVKGNFQINGKTLPVAGLGELIM